MKGKGPMKPSNARYLRSLIQEKVVEEYQAERIDTDHFNRAFKLLNWMWVADECAKLTVDEATQHLIERTRA